MVIDPTSPTRDINRRIMLNLHQDGLLDMLAGFIIIIFGLIPVLDGTGMGAVARQVIILGLFFLGVMAIIWLKRRITFPRAGMVEMAHERKRKISLILLIVNVIIFLVFASAYAFDLSIFEIFGPYQLSVLLGLVFLIVFTVSAALIHAIRFYGYGLVTFISFILFEHLFLKDLVAHHGIPAAAMLSGGLFILTGVVLLAKFLKKYRTDS